MDVLTVPFDDGGAGAAGIGEIVRATVAFGFVCTVRVAAGFGLAVRVAVGLVPAPVWPCGSPWVSASV